MKKQVNKGRKEAKKQKKKDKIMLSTKDLLFKKQLAKKLIKRYVRPYGIKEIVSANAIQYDEKDLQQNKIYRRRKIQKIQKKQQLSLKKE